MRVKDFTVTPSLLPADLNNIQDDYEQTFSAWQDVVYRGGTLSGNNFIQNSSGAGPFLVGNKDFYFDPADFTVTGRAVKLRVRAIVSVNQVAPAATLNFGMYAATVVRGASSAQNSWTLGTQAGSSATSTSPSASTTTTVLSAAFTAPVAGLYLLGLAPNQAVAAGSVVSIAACLQVQRV